MNNLIKFLNAFLSYGLLLVFIVVLCIIAVCIGITLRKKKDAKEATAGALAGETEIDS